VKNKDRERKLYGVRKGMFRYAQHDKCVTSVTNY